MMGRRLRERDGFRTVVPAVAGILVVDVVITLVGATVLWWRAGLTVYSGDALGQLLAIGAAGVLTAIRQRIAVRSASDDGQRRSLLAAVRTVAALVLTGLVLGSGSYFIGWVATWAATLAAALVIGGIVAQALRPERGRWQAACFDLGTMLVLLGASADVHRWDVVFLSGGLVLVGGVALVGFVLRGRPRGTERAVEQVPAQAGEQGSEWAQTGR